MKKNGWMRRVCGTLALLLALFSCVLALAGQTASGAPKVRVAALKGPTGIGAVKLTDNPAYEVTLVSAPDEIVAMVASGQCDIAALPTNLAATLYQKTQGAVKLLALNTLGVLYVLEDGDSVHSVADLAGKELLTTGQSAMPEYVLGYILSQNGIADQVQVTYKAEHTELATLAASGQVKLALLPEPFVTTVRLKNPAMRVALDLTEAFAQAQAADGASDAQLSMGAMIVRTQFAQEHPGLVQAFVSDYGQSVAFVTEQPAEAAKRVAQLGILPSEQVAEAAIPGCHIVFVTGEAMKAQVAPLYEMLYAANPASVGGQLPPDSFYYIAQP